MVPSAPMTIAAVLLAAGAGTRFDGPTHKLLAPWGSGSVFGAALASAASAGLDEVIVVWGAVDVTPVVALAEATTPITVIRNERWADGQATSLQRALAVAAEHAHDAVVVGLGDQPAVHASVWSAVAAADSPIAVASFDVGRRPPVRIAREVWGLVPTEGDTGARELIASRPDLVLDVQVDGDPRDIDTPADLCSDADRQYVEERLGRRPRAPFAVAARTGDGRPTVIANPPLLDDGTPMPTRFWLIDPDLSRAIGTLENAGGVNGVEAELGLDALAVVHERASIERDSLLSTDHVGPRPSGGVGGTRVGVKCLHTHYAAFLAGTDDPVGAWVQARLDESSHHGEVL